MAAIHRSVSDLFAAVASEADNAVCRRELAALLASGCDRLQNQFLGVGEDVEQSHVNLLQPFGVAASEVEVGAYIRVSAALVSVIVVACMVVMVCVLCVMIIIVGSRKQGAFGFHLLQHAGGRVRHDKKGVGLSQALVGLIDCCAIIFAGGHMFEADNVGCRALEFEYQTLAIDHQIQRCHAMLVGAQAGAALLAMLSILVSMCRRGMAVTFICLIVTVIVVLSVAGESQHAQQSAEQQGSVAHGAFSGISK
jgi:hypothetical protein